MTRLLIDTNILVYLLADTADEDTKALVSSDSKFRHYIRYGLHFVPARKVE